MKLSDLQKTGAMSDKEKWVESPIEYFGEDGEKYTGKIMVRKSRWSDARQIAKVTQATDDGVAATISHNVRLDGGKENLTIEQISLLNQSLIEAMLKAINAANPSVSAGKP